MDARFLRLFWETPYHSRKSTSSGADVCILPYILPFCWFAEVDVAPLSVIGDQNLRYCGIGADTMVLLSTRIWMSWSCVREPKTFTG